MCGEEDRDHFIVKAPAKFWQSNYLPSHFSIGFSARIFYTREMFLPVNGLCLFIFISHFNSKTRLSITSTSLMSTQFAAPKHSNRSWTSAQAIAAYNKLRELPKSVINNLGRITVMVVGNGNILDVRNADNELVQTYTNDGTTLQKKIFNTNTRAISGLNNPETKWHFNEGVKAERAGDEQLASDHFQAWLNRCTLSFSVLSTQPEFDTIGKGDEIDCSLESVTTENGTMIGISNKNIKIKAVIAGKTTEATLDDLLAQFTMQDDTIEEESKPAQKATAASKATASKATARKATAGK